MNFKQLFSYFIPIKEFETPSAINNNLEVTWNNGKLVLDSKNTNFSFGSLQRVMRIGLLALGKENVSTAQNILILGVAGGSVIHTLRDEFENQGKITGIELDPEAITIAEKYFGLQKIKNLELLITDAEDFVKTCQITYDLIVVDIFQDKTMPEFLFTESFLIHLKRITATNGKVLFNSIVTLSEDFERNHTFYLKAKQYFTSVQKISNVEGNNELFLLY